MTNKLKKEWSKGIWEVGALYKTNQDYELLFIVLDCPQEISFKKDWFSSYVGKYKGQEKTITTYVNSTVMFLRYHEICPDVLVFLLIKENKIGYIEDIYRENFRYLSGAKPSRRKREQT